MKIFLDTNVLIDFLAKREPHFNNAGLLVSYCSVVHYDILVSALSFATASYILGAHHKLTDSEIVGIFDRFIEQAKITSVDSQTVRESLRLGFSDFEDAMQFHSALTAHADAIITRNKDDFKKSSILVYSPAEFLEVIRE